MTRLPKPDSNRPPRVRPANAAAILSEAARPRSAPSASRAGRFTILAAALCGSLGSNCAVSQESIAPVHGRVRLAAENLTLPGGEKMGWIGAGLLFDAQPHLRLGIESYGAVRGERGGFITLGGSAVAHWPLGGGADLEAGLHIGAGGGRGGLPLAGGGLLVRSHLGIDYRLSSRETIGFGLSQVDFPNGTIKSRQPYLAFAHSFDTLLPAGRLDLPQAADPSAGPATPPAADASHRQRITAVLQRYRIPAGVRTDSGGKQFPSLDLLGIEWNRQLDPRWFVAVESAGAVGGKSQGYMQILGSLGYRLPLSARTAASLSAGAGPAGGGGVDTGGGTLLNARFGLAAELGRHALLELRLGEVRAPSASFRARSAALVFGYAFELPAIGSGNEPDDADQPGVPLAALRGYSPQTLRLRAATQRYRPGPANWRTHHADEPVDSLGFQVDYFLSPQLYLSGQGLAAYAGNAGAYMTGLFGLGGQIPLGGGFFLHAEGLLGAAGGGGMAVGSGLVAQAMAGVGVQFSEAWSLLASAGRIHALDGPLRSDVVGLGLGYRFTAFAK